MSTDGQRTLWRRNIAENFNRLSRAHERHRRQTTDGSTMTYSEFTFAKKRLIFDEAKAYTKNCAIYFGPSCRSRESTARIASVTGLLWSWKNLVELGTVYLVEHLFCTASTCAPLKKFSVICSVVTSYVALWHVSPRLPTISFLVQFGVNLRLRDNHIQVLCSLHEISWCRRQQLTALSISSA